MAALRLYPDLLMACWILQVQKSLDNRSRMRMSPTYMALHGGPHQIYWRPLAGCHVVVFCSPERCLSQLSAGVPAASQAWQTAEGQGWARHLSLPLVARPDHQA